LERELEKRLSLSLNASPAAAAQARHALARTSGMLLERLGREGLLLLTELVNNAVIHGSSSPVDEVSVTVGESSARVRVEVRDDGAGFSWRHPPEEPERASGYGLVLVEAVADRWGIDTSTGRTCVWFEL
jgi:anti-sigma regulatory factor (Ser/Thr protein kinase)